MFCYQCQEANKNEGCTRVGVCGKSNDLATLQDVQIYILKGISRIVIENKLDITKINELNKKVINGIFMTITNANFDDAAFLREINNLIDFRNEMVSKYSLLANGDIATIEVRTEEEMHKLAEKVSVLATENEDIRSLRELIIYGIKGMAAYMHHYENLGKHDDEIMNFVYEALNATTQDLSVDENIKNR